MLEYDRFAYLCEKCCIIGKIARGSAPFFVRSFKQNFVANFGCKIFFFWGGEGWVPILSNPPVLRIQDVYSWSWIQIFLSRSHDQKDPGSAFKNLGIFNPKNCFKLSEIWSGMFIVHPGSLPGFVFHPRPRGKKTHRILIRNTGNPRMDGSR
jgi:hypothetical protein